jgi:hypothetical protein
VGGFQPADVGFALLGHPQQGVARLAIGQCGGQTATLFDPLPHPRNYLEVVAPHEAGNSLELMRFLAFRVCSDFALNLWLLSHS